MNRVYLPCLLGMAFMSLPGLAAQQSVPAGSALTLVEAVARATGDHPELAAARSRVEIARAHRVVAALPPNPEAELEVEELGGPEGAVASLYLGQTVELGGKRGGRIGVAEREIALAESEYRMAQADLRAEVAQAYLAALVAQEEAALAAEASELALEIARVVREQVRAGKVSPVISSRADLAAARSRAAADNAASSRGAAFAALAAHWDGQIDFAAVAGDLGGLPEPPATDRVMGGLATHPAIRVAEEAIACRRAGLALARRMVVPDVTVIAGVSHSDAEADTTFTLGASLPLPVFDRGQGGIALASAEVGEGVAELRAVKRRLTAQARAVVVRLNAEYLRAKRLRDEILPAARETFAAVREGHAAGKLGYLDVLESREALFEIRAEYLDALAAFHGARIELERLSANVFPVTATEE